MKNNLNKTFDFSTALSYARAGIKVCHASWKDSYILFDEDGFLTIYDDRHISCGEFIVLKDEVFSENPYWELYNG